jgi:hypothetical protein
MFDVFKRMTIPCDRSGGGAVVRFPEFIVVALIFTAAFVWSMYLSTFIPPSVFFKSSLWYGADVDRVIRNMTDIHSDFSRMRVHPIFSFLLLPPTKIISHFGAGDILAAHIVTSVSAGIFLISIYLFVRLRGNGVPTGLLVAFCGASTSSFMFWWSVPESFPFGGASIALAFLSLAVKGLKFNAALLNSAMTLAFTSTNWMAGLLVTAVRWPRFEASMISAYGFLSVVIISLWQWAFLSSANFFFLPSAITAERRFVVSPLAAEGPLLYVERFLNFCFFGAVSSRPVINNVRFTRVVSGHLELGSGGLIPLVIWSYLLCLGLKNILKDNNRRYALAILTFILFQAALHIVYGDEPFLYSAHAIPALILVLSFAFEAEASRVAYVAGIVFACSALFVNYEHFIEATRLVSEIRAP